MTRPVSTIFSEYTLRIVDREHFRVVYTLDNWATTLSKDARSVGIRFIVESLPPPISWHYHFYPGMAGTGRRGSLVGRNIDVSVVQLPASAKL